MQLQGSAFRAFGLRTQGVEGSGVGSGGGLGLRTAQMLLPCGSGVNGQTTLIYSGDISRDETTLPNCLQPNVPKGLDRRRAAAFKYVIP